MKWKNIEFYMPCQLRKLNYFQRFLRILGIGKKKCEYPAPVKTMYIDGDAYTSTDCVKWTRALHDAKSKKLEIII